MANSLYDLGREAFGEAGIDFIGDTIKAALVSAVYTANLATDQFFAIVPGGAIVAAGVTLTSKSGSAGTFSAANTTFTSVSGSTVTQIVLYKDTGSSATSPLIGLLDTASGIPLTPNGGNVVINWASGVVFTL